MKDISQVVADAKASLFEGKQAAVTNVATAKSAILGNSVQNQLYDVAEETSLDFDASFADPKRIVKKDGNVRVHADGTISVMLHDGKVLPNVKRENLENILAVEEQKFLDKEAGASKNPIIGVLNTGATVVGGLAKGTLGLLSDSFDVGTSAQTLNEAAAQHNKKANSFSENFLQELKPISDNAIIDYKAFIKRIREGGPSLSSDKEYTNSESFKAIHALENKVAKSKRTFDAVTTATEFIKSYVPTERADDLASSLAFKRVAEDKGTFQAMVHTVLNDFTQLAKQGFESIPYMVAFTIGGPLAQAGILASLAKDKARDVTATFVTQNNREPSTEEQNRIDLFSAVSTVAEKFGDMAALKALPFARVGRANNISKEVVDLLPPSVKQAFSKTKLITSPSKALAGEGLSGTITAVADQIAATGEVGDVSEVGYSAISEAVGSVGGIGGLVAGKLAVGAAKGTVAAINAPSKEEVRKTKVSEELEKVEAILTSEKGVTVGQLERSQDTVAKLVKLRVNLEEAIKPIADDFNRDQADTENEIFNIYYEKNITEGQDPETAIKNAKEFLATEIVQAKAEEVALTEHLTQPAEETEAAAYTKVITGKRDALKEALAADKFSNKDLKESKAAKIAKEEAAKKPNTSKIEPTEFDKLMSDVNTSDTQKAAKILLSTSTRTITIAQEAAIALSKNKLLKKLGSKTLDLADKATGSLGIFNSVAPTDGDSGRKDIVPTTATDKKILDARIEADKLESSIQASETKDGGKTTEQVNDEVLTGKHASKWKGLKTIQDTITKLLSDTEMDSDLVDTRVRKELGDLNRHAGNMIRKAAEFKKALFRAQETGQDVLIKATEHATRKRHITYEIVENTKEMKKSGYITTISPKGSTRLVGTVQNEAAYAKAVQTISVNYKDSSFRDQAIQQRLEVARNKATIAAIQGIGTDTSNRKKTIVSSENLQNPEGTNPIKESGNFSAFSKEELTQYITAAEKRLNEALRDPNLFKEVNNEIGDLLAEAKALVKSDSIGDKDALNESNKQEGAGDPATKIAPSNEEIAVSKETPTPPPTPINSPKNNGDKRPPPTSTSPNIKSEEPASKVDKARQALVAAVTRTKNILATARKAYADFNAELKKTPSTPKTFKFTEDELFDLSGAGEFGFSSEDIQRLLIDSPFARASLDGLKSNPIPAVPLSDADIKILKEAQHDYFPDTALFIPEEIEQFSKDSNTIPGAIEQYSEITALDSRETQQDIDENLQKIDVLESLSTYDPEAGINEDGAPDGGDTTKIEAALERLLAFERGTDSKPTKADETKLAKLLAKGKAAKVAFDKATADLAALPTTDVPKKVEEDPATAALEAEQDALGDTSALVDNDAAFENEEGPSAADIAEFEAKERKAAEKRPLPKVGKVVSRSSLTTPVNELSAQFLSAIFTDILSKEGTILFENSSDTGFLTALQELAVMLNVSAEVTIDPESSGTKLLIAALETLPDTKNYIENPIGKLPAVISDKRLTFNKEKQYDNLSDSKKDKLGTREEGVASLVANSADSALGIIGKSFSDLVQVKENEFGLFSLPNSAFIPTETGQYRQLRVALVSLGMDSESAAIMAKEYAVFNERYQKVRNIKDFVHGVQAAKLPLDLLQDKGGLPPQLVFAMSIGIMQLLHRSPTNNVFNSDWAAEDFLYGSYSELSDSDRQQVSVLGHGYQNTADAVGKEIVKLLKISPTNKKYGAYFDNLSVSLGLAAIQIEHGPGESISSNLEESEKEKDNTSRLHVETHEWAFTDGYREERRFNNNVTQEEADVLNAERQQRIKDNPKPTWKAKDYSKVKDVHSIYKELIELSATLPNNLTKLTGKDKQTKQQIADARAEIDYRQIVGDIVKAEFFEYKHIKIHTSITMTEVENGDPVPVEHAFEFDDVGTEGAIASLSRVFDVVSQDRYPLQVASTSVTSSVRNSLGGVPTEVSSVLGQIQEVVWKKADSLLHVDTIAKLPNGTKVLHYIAGVVPILDTEHETQVLSKTAKNQNKITDLDNLLDALDKGKLENFHFTYRLQNQHRILMEGMINPQQSRISRTLVRSYEPVTYTKENLWLFKLAVASNLGVKIDKDNLEAAEVKFEEIIANENVKLAVTAISQLDDPKQAAIFLKALPKILKDFGGDLSIITALTALAKYSPTKSFSSDIILEIDGISNGFAQNVAQFPLFGEDSELRDQQVGTYSAKEGEEGSVRHNTKLEDIYQSLVKRMNKHSSAFSAKKYYKNRPLSFDKDDYNAKNKALYEVYKDLRDENSRDLVKYPFLIFMYGGGITSISEGVAKKVVQSLYEQLGIFNAEIAELKNLPANSSKEKTLNNTLAKQAKAAEVEQFAKHLETLGAFVSGEEFANRFKSKEDFIKHMFAGTSTTLYLNDKNIVEEAGEVLAPRFAGGLNELLGDTTKARGAVMQAGEILHAVFMAHYQKASRAALKNGRTSLSKSEINQLIEDKLLEVFPQYKGPLITKEERALIDLTKRALLGDISNETETKFEYKNKEGKVGVTKSAPRQSVFVAPGVTALIRLIINMDSAVLTKTLAEHPNVLMLHDAIMANPEILLEAQETYGKWHLKLNAETSVLEVIHDQMIEVMKITDAADEANGNGELRREIENWITYSSNANTFADGSDRNPYLSLDALMGTVTANKDEVLDARAAQAKKLKDAGLVPVSRQLYMPLPETKSTETPNLISQIKDDIQETVDGIDPKNKPDDTTPTQPDVIDGPESTDPDMTSFGSLDNFPRDNPGKDPLVTDLDSSNATELFSKMSSFSDNYYSSPETKNAHSSALENVLNLLKRGMDATTQTRLTIEDIDGITQGRYDSIRDDLRVSLSRQAPLSVNGQSPQEVYIHELVHAMTFAAIRDNPLIAKRIEAIYNRTKKELDANGKHKVFLEGIKNPSAQDITTARRQYNYLFDNSAKEANKLHEFLAYAVTNRSLSNYLGNQLTSLPVRDKGIKGQLLHALDLIVDTFEALIHRKRYKRAGQVNALQEMLAVTEHLVGVQSKHQSQFETLSLKTEDALNEADKKIREFGERQSMKIARLNPKGKIQEGLQNAAGVVGTIFSENIVAQETREKVNLVLNKTMRAVANEIGGGALSEKMIEQLLHAKVNISKARQESERFTTELFNNIWKSVDPSKPHTMDVHTREALTEVLLRADLSSLKSIGISSADIVKTLSDPNAILKQQAAILRKLNLKTTDRAIIYAVELGRHISIGGSRLNQAHTNAYTIAKDEVTNFTVDDVQLLDAYATLSALENIDRRNLDAVSTLAKAEFEKDGRSNGIIDMIDSHLLFKRKSLKDLFDGNPTQMVKGFIVERVDNLTSMKTGTAADEKQMKKDGFTKAFPLGKLTDIKQAHDTLYVSYSIPEVPDVSGIMSTTNQRNMGTTLTEIFSKDPAFQNADGGPNFVKIDKEIKVFHRKETSRAQNLDKTRENALVPVRDDNGKITDYRVMMDHQTKKKLLRPDLEIQNVFAHMHSTYVDRKNTIDNDLDVIKSLVHEQSDMLKSHKKLFIDFLDPKEGYIDRYRKLPREVREYIKDFSVDGKFMIRADIVDKVFGYQAFDFSQLKILQDPSWGRAKRYAGIFHYMLRQIVGYGKDRIVVAMPKVVLGNIVSNIAQLSMRHIPLTFTIHKIVEGFQEYQKYQSASDELRKIVHTIESKGLGASSEESKRKLQLEAQLEGNKIHRMSAAGLNSLIVEDVNTAKSGGYIDKMHRSLKNDSRFNKVAKRIPKFVGETAAVLFMSRSSVPYQLSRKFVQLNDFLARYVMIEHMTKVQNVSFDVAMHKSLDAFVVFDEALVPALDALEAVGATSFLSYFLRNQRSSKQLVQSNPTGVALAAGIQAATGVPALGNINASWLAGDFSPNLFQLDDLWDEANNVTGADLIRDLYSAIFN